MAVTAPRISIDSDAALSQIASLTQETLVAEIVPQQTATGATADTAAPIIINGGTVYLTVNEQNFTQSTITNVINELAPVGNSGEVQFNNNGNLGAIPGISYNTANTRFIMGDVSNISIAGGSAGQSLTTDGLGNLSWQSVNTSLDYDFGIIGANAINPTSFILQATIVDFGTYDEPGQMTLDLGTF